MIFRRNPAVAYDLVDRITNQVLTRVDLQHPLETISIVQPVEIHLGNDSHTFTLRNLYFRLVKP